MPETQCLLNDSYALHPDDLSVSPCQYTVRSVTAAYSLKSPRLVSESDESSFEINARNRVESAANSRQPLNCARPDVCCSYLLHYCSQTSAMLLYTDVDNFLLMSQTREVLQTKRRH